MFFPKGRWLTPRFGLNCKVWVLQPLPADLQELVAGSHLGGGRAWPVSQL